MVQDTYVMKDHGVLRKLLLHFFLDVQRSSINPRWPQIPILMPLFLYLSVCHCLKILRCIIRPNCQWNWNLIAKVLIALFFLSYITNYSGFSNITLFQERKLKDHTLLLKLLSQFSSPLSVWIELIFLRSFAEDSQGRIFYVKGSHCSSMKRISHIYPFKMFSSVDVFLNFWRHSYEREESSVGYSCNAPSLSFYFSWFLLFYFLNFFSLNFYFPNFIYSLVFSISNARYFCPPFCFYQFLLFYFLIFFFFLFFDCAHMNG